MKQLGEIPRADIHYDGAIGKRHNHALEPDGPHIGMGKHQTHDEKDEGQTEQMNMRHANQREDIRSGILLGHLLDVVVAAQIRKMRVAAVVASHAALPATRRVMVERFRRGDLSSLRHSRLNLVAFAAGYFLMLGMIESHPKGWCRRGGPGIPTQLMTRATRRDVAAAGLRTRRVASKTSCVRVESRRYRKGSAARRTMARRTTDAAHLYMLRVIELHPKALQTRKRFQGPGSYVGVTDGADRTLGA